MDASAEAADAQAAPEEDREGLQMQLALQPAAAQDRDQAAQALRKAFLEAGADARLANRTRNIYSKYQNCFEARAREAFAAIAVRCAESHSCVQSPALLSIRHSVARSLKFVLFPFSGLVCR